MIPSIEYSLPKHRGRPTQKSYEMILAHFAEKANVCFRDALIAHTQTSARVRWRAWRALMKAGYSCAGISHTSGFHHTAIMRAVKQLRREEPCTNINHPIVFPKRTLVSRERLTNMAQEIEAIAAPS